VLGRRRHAAATRAAQRSGRLARLQGVSLTMTITAASVAGRPRAAAGHRTEAAGDAAEERPAELAGASGGERLAVLFDRHHARLFRLACRLTADREEARDLVQEAFLRAARHATGVPPGAASGEAWLVRTLVNLCRDHHRRLSVRVRAWTSLAAAAASAAHEVPATPGPESMVVARATVRAGLARLPPRRRAVLVLHEIEELPVDGIARLLGIAAVTVRWHLMVARRELAAALLAPSAGAAGRPPEKGDAFQ
jgi:RNA polymerase sigma-70 factor (ECF subfamily)